jgi:hypothetical protein
MALTKLYALGDEEQLPHWYRTPTIVYTYYEDIEVRSKELATYLTTPIAHELVIITQSLRIP